MSTTTKSKTPPIYILLFSTLMGIWMVLVAAPLLVRLFVSFPSLDQAEHLEGTISSKLVTSTGRSGPGRMANIEIDTGQRKIKLDCGFFLDPHPCPDFHLIDGAKGEVWVHPLFGVIQWRLISPSTGHQFHISFDVERDYYENNFPWKKYLEKLIGPVLGLVLGLFLMKR